MVYTVLFYLAMCCVIITSLPVPHPFPSMHVFTYLDDRLDGYQKKKYVYKLLFIFLLSNDVDFGHQEAVNLLPSIRFSEKQIESTV